MHKTLSINLGGLFFHIAEDAFEQLDAYFTSLHRYFDDNNGNEIVTDIEARVAEMFTDTLQSQRRQVIMADDVKKVIAVMGHPEELASDNLNTVADTTTPNIPNTGSQNTSAASESSANNSNDTANPNYKTTNNNEQTEQQQATSSFASRRLYRNPDDTIVGGVCSGIAAYAGISDPLWIRLAFVAASVLGGMSFMFYILLMVIIPKAKTPAQKLAMRGKPINVSSIEQAFKQGVNTLNNAIDEFNEGETGQRTRQFFHNFRAQAQAKAKNINYERGIRLFAKIIAIIIVGSILLGLVSAFVGVLSALAYSFSFLNNFVFDSFAQLVISSISLLAVFGIPVLLVGYLIFKRSFRVRSRYHWGRIMVGIWLLSLLSLLVTGGNTYRTEFAHKANFNDALPITKMANNQTLALQLQPDDRNMNALMDWEFGPSNGLVSFDTENKALYFTFPDISIKKSDNAELSFSKAVSAQGGTTNEAAENAQSIIPMFSQTDSVLSFKPYYQTAPGQKWRNQTMTYVLNIPVGQQIFIDKNLADYIWDIDLAPGYRHRQLSGNIWKMTPNGLALLSGDKTNGNENSASAGNIPNIEAINLSAFGPEKAYDFANFDLIDVSGNLEIVVLNSEEYSVKFAGNESDLEKLDITQDGSGLKINWGGEPKIKGVITLPLLDEIHLANKVNCQLSGFENNNFSLHASTGSTCEANLTTSSFEVALSGGSTLNLQGQGNQMSVELSGSSKINAANFKVEDTEITASGDSYAELNTTNSITASASGSSTIYYLGDPKQIEKNTSGSSVIDDKQKN